MTMTKAIITIKDEVACHIDGLDLAFRKRMQKKFSYMYPHAYHTPAFKLGRWNGKAEFFALGGATYNNLLEDVIPELITAGYEIEVIDNRVAFNSPEWPQVTAESFAHVTWPVGHPAEGEAIELRDYQITAINKYLENPQCIQELSTSSGKTITTAALCKIVESQGRTVTIVPSQNLVTQTLEDYENLGLDVGVYYGAKKEIGKQHTIYTWQSMSAVIRQKRADKLSRGLEELLEGVVAIIVDEAHGAAANDLKTILSGAGKNIPLRWGLTGTEPPDEISRMSLKVMLGPVVNRVRAVDLQEQGYLSSSHINVMQMVEDVVYSNYQSELSYLTTNDDRLDYLAGLLVEVAQDGNTLFLVDRVKTGEGLMERLGDHNAVFISGGMKAGDRKDHYDEVREIDNKIIIATYGVAAVGLNIPRLYNIMLLEAGKSFIRVIQSIGRGLRKAKDKDHVEIWDICSTAKYSKRHLTSRKKFYKDAGYKFTIKKIKYREL